MTALGSGSGKGVVNIQSQRMCEVNCYFSFLLLAPNNSIIRITTHAYESERLIEPF